MRFSIQEQNQPKQFFHFIPAAQKETGIPNSIIKSALERINPRYHRKSDNKIFFIQKEPQIKILTIAEEDFFSLEELKEKFGLSPTKIFNQLKNKSVPQKIDWISPELFSSREENEVPNEVASPKSVSSPVLTTPPIPLPQTKKVPPIPFPRTEVPQEEIKVPPMPPEVAEILETGETFPFETTKKIKVSTFDSITSLAFFIKSGLKGKLLVHGPKKNQNVIFDGKIVSLPDLVKEIIVFHIREKMWKHGDHEASMAFSGKLVDYCSGANAKKDFISKISLFIGKIRRLDEETVWKICKELMKFL